jgi:hypothetical protein
MTPEEKSLLERTYRLAEENSKMLKSLYRASLWSRATTAFYWLFIIGATFGAYFVIEPYIKIMTNLAGSASGGLQNISDLSELLK